MSRSDRAIRKIEERLAPGPRPVPPQDLLQHIVDEIPEDLGADAADRGSSTPWWKLAAAVVLVVGGGIFAYSVALRAPDPGSNAGETVEEDATVPSAVEAEEASREPIRTADPADGAQRSTEAADGLPLESREDQSRARREPASERPAAGSDRQEQTVSKPQVDDEAHLAAEEGTYREREFRVAPPPPPRSPEPAAPVGPDAVAQRVAPRRAESISRLQALGYVGRQAAPSTGGTAEPNDQPYGDMFFGSYGENPFIDTEDDALSTFGLDVDTGSWTLVRSYVDRGNLPPRDAVRVEELVNAFDYGDPAPRRGDFELVAEGARTPYGESADYHLLRFGLRARDVLRRERPPVVLVFTVDTSGSMAREDRLGLVKRSLELLVEELGPRDEVGLVTFGSSARVVLDPTADRGEILRALDWLRPEGSTNAEQGLRTAYDLVQRYRREGSLHRVILCSDGVANVGATGPESILESIGRWAREGIELTTIGFGMGNYNDLLMEQLADRGDGRYHYVDTLEEARRVFVDDLAGTLVTVAEEARAQVEFDSSAVERYRLLGYENRDIADRDFRNDRVDAGEIGAGHHVTALYEVKLREGLRARDVVATLRLRYRSAETEEWIELAHDLTAGELADRWERAPRALRLAGTVAELAELLKGTYWARGGDLDAVAREAERLARELRGDAEVAELARVARRAAELAVREPGPAGEE